MLEKTLESLLNSKEIKSVNPKRNQPWIFIGRTDAEDEAPVFCPPTVKNWLIGKDPDVGKDWRQEEKRATKNEMVGWYHWLSSVQFSSVTQSCPTLCNPMPGLPVQHQLMSIELVMPSISSSVVPFSSCLQSFPASGSFLRSWLFTSGGQSIGASSSASVLPMNNQDWFPLKLTGLISLYPRDS